MYAGTSVTIRKDFSSTETDLTFVKEFDGTTAAPGVTVVNNANGTQTVTIDADSANYDSVFLYKASGSGSGATGKVFVIDEDYYAGNSSSFVNYLHRVTVNGTRTENYTLGAHDTIVSGLKTGDVVEMRYVPAGFKRGHFNFNVGLEFKYNPLGDVLGTHTHADLCDHFRNKIISTPGQYASGIGISNYYNTNKPDNYGGTILQGNPSQPLAQYIKQNDRNVITALRSAMNDYDNFRNQFVAKAKQVHDTTTFSHVRDLVDETFTQLNVGKDKSFRYASSGMVHWYSPRTQEITITDVSVQTFTLTNAEVKDRLSAMNDHVYVYLKDYDSGTNSYIDRLLTRTSEYTLSGNQLTLRNPANVNNNVPPVLTVKFYNRQNNSFVPWSAAKLNLTKCVTPGISGSILTAHDGSKVTVKSSSELNNPQGSDFDVKTAVLLELELRIFAGVDKIPFMDQIEYKPRYPYNTQGGGTRVQWTKHYRSVFEYWLDSNGKPYPSFANSLAVNNYSNQNDGQGVQLPGHTDGVLEYYTGTKTPHTTPWEIFGYKEKPDWWDNNYDWRDSANGGSDVKRAALLVAVDKGHYNNPADAQLVSLKYAVKQNMDALIDVTGTLQTNLASIGWATTPTTTKDFEVGDGFSAEDEFKATSAYHFAIAEANFRNSPHNFWSQFQDPSSLEVSNTQLINNKTRQRRTINDPVYNSPVSGGVIDSITVTNQGSGYSSSPTVTVTGNGAGAEVSATVVSGKVVDIKVTKAGFGYTNAGITITDSTGANATATISLVKNQTFKTTGLLALVWLHNSFSKNGINLHDRNAKTSAQPLINLEGFTDKNVIKVRTLGNSSSPPFVIQDNDIEIALHKSAAKSKFHFTAIKVTKNSIGFTVNGFEEDQKYFEYYEANTGGATKRITFANQSVDVHTKFNPDGGLSELNYEHKFDSLTDLANFVAGRTEFVIRKGCDTFTIDSSVKNLLEWVSTATVGQSTFLHAADELKFNDTLNSNVLLTASTEALTPVFVDSVYTTNNTVLVEDASTTSGTKESLLNNIKATRVEKDGATVYTEDKSKILRINVDYVHYDHCLILANRTLFADNVYRPDIGMSYEMYKLEGRRTIDWGGEPSTKGYLVAQDGVVQNYDSSVREVEDDYFVVDSNALNKEKRKIAQTAIGYNKPTWADKLPISDDNSFDYYRSAVSTKGTKNNLKGLGRHSEIVDPDTDSFDINDQWLFKTSDFAADNKTFIEMEYTDELVKTNPQGVKLSSDGVADSQDDEIITLQTDDKRLVTKLSTPNQFALGSDYYHQNENTFNEFQGWLQNAGYPLVSEVNEQALTIDDIPALYDETKDYATIEAWDNTISYKNGDKVRYQDKVYQCSVTATGLTASTDPITWNGTVTNPVILPGNTLVIDSNTINLTNNVTTTTFNNIVLDSQANPIVNGGDNITIDGTLITFVKSSTTTSYPDFAVAGSTVNPTIVGSATKTLIINGTTINFNETEATTINRDWTYCVSDQMTSASVSSVTAANRITAWANMRASFQSVYGNASTRTKLDTYLNTSEAGFDTSVLVTEHGATGNATLQGHILTFLTQDVTIINELAGTSYVTADVLNGSTPVNASDETTTQTAFNTSTYTDDIHNWLTASANDSTAILGTIIVMSEAGTQFKTYSASEIVSRITAGTPTNATASLVSNQLTITRTNRTAGDKDLVIGPGTANAEVDNAGTTFPSSGSLTHTGSETTTTSTTAQLTNQDIVDQINASGITNIGSTLQTNVVRVTKTTTSLSPNITLSGTAISDLGGNFTTGTITSTTSTTTSPASLSVGLVAQKINDAGITGITAAVVSNRIVITSINASGIMASTQAALDLGIASNILGVTRTASTTASTNTFDVSDWSEIGEPLLEYIWIANDVGYDVSTISGITAKFNSWNVFKVMDMSLYATKICAAVTTGTGNDAEVQCNSAHNLQKGDIILLLNTNSTPVIDGFHTVTGIDTGSTVKFYIDQYIDADASYAKLLVLRPVRFGTDANRNSALSATNFYKFLPKDRVWVDNTSQFSVYEYNSGSTWDTKRTQGDNHVNPTTVQRSILHDRNFTITEAEAYDPFKGIVPGIADLEITYKSINDPAIYTSSTDTTAQINQQQAWGSDHAGEVWWDTNKAIYIDYEQDSIEYRTQYWGTLFKGGQIDCYEWTRSDVAPDQYTVGKVIDGVELTGEPYNVTDKFGNILYYYTEVDEYDSTIGANVTYYYFWVKNKTSVPLGSDRTNSVLNIAKLIENPTSQGIKWLNATGKDSFVAGNLRDNVTENSVLQISNVSSEENAHKHWTAIVENNDEIPEYFHRRLKDGLRGNNDHRVEKVFKGQWSDFATTYAKGEIVSIDAPISALVVSVAAKTANNRFNGYGSGNAYYINGSDTDFGQVLTLQRGKTYLFDQNTSTNQNHALILSPTLDAFLNNNTYYETATDGVTYYLDGVASTLAQYNTAINNGANTQDKKVQIKVTANTPNTLWYGCHNHRLMGNQINVVNEEMDQTPAYYMSLIDNNSVHRPQTNRKAWRRIFDLTDIDEIEEVAKIPEDRHVPDLNLHPFDRIGESIRPSRSWFPYKNLSRREVISKLNAILLETNLVDSVPDYKTHMDVTITKGSNNYTLSNYWENIDWYHKDFDSFVQPNRTVTEITPLLTSGDSNQLNGQYDGEYILAKDVLHADGITRDSIFKYVQSTDTWLAVFKEKGTIQLDSRLHDQVQGQYGFDTVGFDNAGFDADPIHELVELLDIFKTHILSKEDYNKVWFSSIYDAIRINDNNEWIKKSTYIIPKLRKRINSTKRIGYDAVEVVEEYLDKNKPFSSKYKTNPSYFQDQKEANDQGSAIITEQSRNMVITDKIEEHTDNEFAERLGDTAVIVNTPLPFDDVNITKTFNTVDYSVARNGIVTSWIHSTGNVVSATDAIGDSQHLVTVPADIEKLSHDRDFVYVRTSGVTDASGGPGYVVAPDTEVNIKDQRPTVTTQYNWKIPKQPVTASTKPLRGSGPIGVLTNGVAIFSPRDFEQFGSGAYYRNEAYLRRYEMDPNNGTGWSSKGDNDPTISGLYYHWDLPSEYASVEDATKHSKIIGWALDGFPIYGPYGFANTDGTGAITKMTSSYVLRTGARVGIDAPSGNYDGSYTQDYVYDGSGILDQYNGRFAVTPEYPNGIYHYHATPDAYPYFVGDEFNGEKNGATVYDGVTTIEPWRPSVITAYDQHEVTANGGAFTTADDAFTFIYDGQNFLNRYEIHGNAQYKADFNEALDIRVQTNPGGTVTAGPTYSVAGEENQPRGITFNNDGTKMFITGPQGDDVNEYTLSTGFDLSSTVTFIDSYAVSECPNPTAVKFNADGTKMFVTGTGNSNVHEYALSTGFDVSTASFTQTLVTTVDNDNFGLDFKPDGTKMYITGNQNNKIYEFNLSSAFDISTATFNQDRSSAAEDFEPFGIEFNTDGTKMFIVGTLGNGVDLYELSTGFDISTATHVEFYFIGGNPSGIHFSPDGLNMFITGNQADLVKSFTLAAPYTFTGGYVSADTRSFIYFQNDDLDVSSSVVINTRKDTINGAITSTAKEITVNNIDRFFNPNFNYVGKYIGSNADDTYAKFGTHSLRFSNTTDSELYVPSLSTMQNGEIHFWIYMDSTATDARILTSNLWGLRRSAAGTIDVIDSDGLTLGIGATGLDDGAWHHISITCDGTTLSISKDQNIPATASVTQFANISGIQFGATTRLTNTYSGNAADNVWIDQMCIRATATHTTLLAAANPPLADPGLVLENYEPIDTITVLPIDNGVVTIGTERIKYGAIDIANSKLLSCTRGADGTGAIAHSNGATVIDCSNDLSVSANRQIWQYNNELDTAYNDPSTSLASGTGLRPEAIIIRAAGRGELF